MIERLWLQAEVAGEVVAFLAQNGEPVSFNQPLVEVRSHTSFRPSLHLNVRIVPYNPFSRSVVHINVRFGPPHRSLLHSPH
jgi:hypothetical protein